MAQIQAPQGRRHEKGLLPGKGPRESVWGWQRVIVLTALHPTNKQQPGLALGDPALTIGWAEPSSTRTQKCWSPTSRLCLLHSKVWHREGWEHGPAGQQAGCPGNLGAGMLSRAAGELMSQSLQQDHGGRASWKPTHTDAHPWSRAVGEGSRSLLPELSCESAAWGAGRRGELPAAGDGTAGHGQELTLFG